MKSMGSRRSRRSRSAHLFIFLLTLLPLDLRVLEVQVWKIEILPLVLLLSQLPDQGRDEASLAFHLILGEPAPNAPVGGL